VFDFFWGGGGEVISVEKAGGVAALRLRVRSFFQLLDFLWVTSFQAECETIWVAVLRQWGRKYQGCNFEAESETI
jgi:hypothetical protein